MIKNYVNFSRWVARHFVALSIAAFTIPIVFRLLNFAMHRTARKHPLDFVDWILTQYSVTYFQFGFIKRGLIGTLFSPVPPEAMRYVIVVFGIAVSAVALWLWARIFARALTEDDEGMIALAPPVAIGAYGFAQAGFDVARLDRLLLLLFVLAAECALRRRAVAATAVSLVAMLIHEAYFIFACPIIAALLLQSREPLKQRGISLAVFIAATGTLAVAIALYGNDPRITMQTTPGFGQEVWNRGLREAAFGQGPLEHILLALSLMAAYGWLVLCYRAQNRRPDLLFVTCFFPISLFWLGIDTPRWCALITAVIAIVLVLRHRTEGLRLPKPASAALVIVYTYLSLPVGPIGKTEFYPIVVQGMAQLAR